MAIKVNFYRFTKKENSTARPAGSGTELDCILKDSSSIFYPVLKLNLGAISAPSFNYCVIPVFNRWYFVTNWEWDNGLWIASLKVDVLATYKPEIGNTSLYALRASNQYDGAIVDNLYPTKTGCTFEQSETWYPSRGLGIVQTFILGIVSKNPSYGSVNYYAVDNANLYTIVNELLDDTLLSNNGFNAQDASIALQKSLVDPLQYIKSAISLPFTLAELNNIASSATPVTVFNWTLTATARKVSGLLHSPITEITHSFPIPKHPQSRSRGNYMNQGPYTHLTLHAPPFGNIELDTTAFVDASTIDITILLDMPTGLAILEIKNGNYVVNRVESNMGVPIQLTQVTRDYLGAASSTISAIGGTVGSVMSGNIGGAISNVATGIESAARAMVPRSQTIGSGGSYAQMRSLWFVEAQFFSAVDDDINHNGRPLCQMVTPSSGYYLIQDGDVPIDGTQEEAIEVKRYLEGGFYYE